MKKIITYLILITQLLLILSCGKSPFLDDNFDDQKSHNSLATLNSSPSRSNHFKLNLYSFWSKNPEAYEFTELLLVSTNSQNLLTDIDGTLIAKTWMPSMNHGVNEAIKVEKKSLGVYGLKNIFFSMKGDWKLIVQINDRHGRKVEEITWDLLL